MLCIDSRYGVNYTSYIHGTQAFLGNTIITEVCECIKLLLLSLITYYFFYITINHSVLGGKN